MFRFQTKICGITSVADARVVASAGADAVGLNFYGGSPRCIDVALGRDIAAAAGPDVFKVGVFVNQPTTLIAEVVQQVGLDAVQLHGDEPPEMLTDLPASATLIRAWRLGSEGLAPLAEWVAAAAAAGRRPDAVLIDARVEGAYGGTGACADWRLLSDYPAYLGDTPLILAGGLTADNVAEAIARVRPAAVDTASGVESSPGQKKPELVRAFVEQSQAAFSLVR